MRLPEDIKVKLGDEPISAEELADILRVSKDYQEGEPIRLLSCRTGDAGRWVPVRFDGTMFHDTGSYHPRTGHLGNVCGPRGAGRQPTWISTTHGQCSCPEEGN